MNLGMEPPPYDPDFEHPPPEGWRRVTFTGGTLHGQQKLVRVSVQEGDDYNLILSRERYRYNGHTFVLQNPDIEWPE